MDLSTPRPQQQSGLPPEKAFWKALTVVGTTSIVVWASLWIFVGLRIGLQGDEWILGSILAGFTILVLTPLVYSSYRRGPARGRNSRRANILIAIAYTVSGVARIGVVLQQRGHGSMWAELVFAFGWLLFASFFFYRAFKSNDTVSLPS